MEVFRALRNVEIQNFRRPSNGLENDTKSVPKKWERLSPHAKLLLVSGSHFSPTNGACREGFVAISGLSEQVFTEAEGELIKEGLLSKTPPKNTDTSRINTGCDRRYVPANVQSFVFHDILLVEKDTSREL